MDCMRNLKMSVDGKKSATKVHSSVLKTISRVSLEENEILIILSVSHTIAPERQKTQKRMSSIALKRFLVVTQRKRILHSLQKKAKTLFHFRPF